MDKAHLTGEQFIEAALAQEEVDKEAKRKQGKILKTINEIKVENESYKSENDKKEIRKREKKKKLTEEGFIEAGFGTRDRRYKGQKKVKKK